MLASRAMLDLMAPASCQCGHTLCQPSLASLLAQSDRAPMHPEFPSHPSTAPPVSGTSRCGDLLADGFPEALVFEMLPLLGLLCQRVESGYNGTSRQSSSPMKEKSQRCPFG